MRKVRRSHDLPAAQRLLRRVGAGFTTFILPCFVVDADGGLTRAESLLDAGYGLVVLLNHFSTRDGPQVLSLLGRNRTMRRRTFLGPVAHHQWRRHGLLVRVLTNLFAIRLFPVVTPHAEKMYGPRQRQGDGLRAYLWAASAGLKQGNIVLLAPQARRRQHLGAPPRGRPVAKLLAQARADKVQHIALVFVGLSIPHEDDYSRDNVGGMNFSTLYEARFGPTFTVDEALRESQGMASVDDWVFARLRDLVPPAYGNRAGAHVSHDKSAPDPRVTFVPDRDGGVK